MNIYINENIKKLRREKNITQEKLAEYLNISTQAVSKWERGESFPDICMIMPLANYFNVSTDELLGYSEAKNKAEIEKYIEESSELFRVGRVGEADAIIKKAHKEYPNDYRLMCSYMYCIIGNTTDNDPKVVLEYAEELTGLCERILNECTVNSARNDAIDILAKIKKAEGKYDEAVKFLADNLPDFYMTCGQKSEQLFDKRTPEWWHWVKDNFKELASFAHNKLLKIIWYTDKKDEKEVSFEEKKRQTERVAEYLLKIYEETKWESLRRMIGLTYGEIGRQYNFTGEYSKIAPFYDLQLSYLDSSANTLDWLTNNPWFENARKDAGFVAMLEKYKE